MKLLLDQDDIEKIETLFSLHMNSEGLHYNGLLISWSEVDNIKKRALDEQKPINQSYTASIQTALKF